MDGLAGCGWRHPPADRASITGPTSPLAGDAARSCPMTEKRRCALPHFATSTTIVEWRDRPRVRRSAAMGTSPRSAAFERRSCSGPSRPNEGEACWKASGVDNAAAQPAPSAACGNGERPPAIS